MSRSRISCRGTWPRRSWTERKENHMNARILVLCFLVVCPHWAVGSEAQSTVPKEQQEVLALSKDKWRWMSERNLDALGALFHEKAVFVHMGGTMSRSQELDVIKSGGIQYKHA